MAGKIRFTHAALVASTDAQRATLAHHANSDNAGMIDADVGGFDLPTGYLAIRIVYKTGNSIVGGISPEGDTST